MVQIAAHFAYLGARATGLGALQKTGYMHILRRLTEPGNTYRGPVRVVPATLAALLVAYNLKLQLTIGHIDDIRSLNIRECLYTIEGLLPGAQLSTRSGALRNARRVQSVRKRV